MPTGTKRVHRNDDYFGVFPPGVIPIGDLDILEQGHSLLIIKSYEWNKVPPPKHVEIARLSVRMANLDSPGTITFVMVWGLGPSADRRWRIFDRGAPRNGEERVGKREDWQLWLSDWFKMNRTGR